MALMNCPACEKECSTQATQCPHCGQPLNQNRDTTPPPKTWLLESILATILCCLLGVVGIVYAAKVENLWNQGRKQEALEASKNAKTWTLVSVFVGLGIGIIYGILMALGMVSGLASGYY